MTSQLRLFKRIDASRLCDVRASDGIKNEMLYLCSSIKLRDVCKIIEIRNYSTFFASRIFPPSFGQIIWLFSPLKFEFVCEKFVRCMACGNSWRIPVTLITSHIFLNHFKLKFTSFQFRELWCFGHTKSTTQKLQLSALDLYHRTRAALILRVPACDDSNEVPIYW